MSRTLLLDHEELRVRRAPRSGATIIVAIHSTSAGPATGGCRIKTYAHWRDGLDDALRLSAAMTLKCALGGLPYGGGKTVVVPTGALAPGDRPALLADIGEVVASFDGRYITGPDIGTDPQDMAVLHAATGGAAFCRPEELGGSGNSAAATAYGVLAALRAAVERTFDQIDVAGLRVCVIGYGSVGALIAQALATDGADVLVHDTDPRHRADVEAARMTWSDDLRLDDDFDVLIPAATGGLLSAQTASTCGARLIVGPANNQLTDDRVDAVLHGRGVTWIPDALASGGGVIYAASREGLKLDDAAAHARVEAIGRTTVELLAHLAAHGTTPLEAARHIAARRVGEAP